MANLKPHHLELLRLLVARLGPVPISELDGRQLRPLKASGLVTQYGQSVLPTTEGRRLAHNETAGRGEVKSPAPVSGASLSGAQEKLLRLLLRSPDPLLADHLDGRVLRALEARRLIRIEDGWVSATDGAAVRFEQHTRKERSRRTRRAAFAPGGHARAEALRRAVEQLESAFPRGAEVMIAEMPAYADDVFVGLRRLARQLESRSE